MHLKASQNFDATKRRWFHETIQGIRVQDILNLITDDLEDSLATKAQGFRGWRRSWLLLRLYIPGGPWQCHSRWGQWYCLARFWLESALATVIATRRTEKVKGGELGAQIEIWLSWVWSSLLSDEGARHVDQVREWARKPSVSVEGKPEWAICQITGGAQEAHRRQCHADAGSQGLEILAERGAVKGYGSIWWCIESAWRAEERAHIAGEDKGEIKWRQKKTLTIVWCNWWRGGGRWLWFR